MLSTKFQKIILIVLYAVSITCSIIMVYKVYISRKLIMQDASKKVTIKIPDEAAIITEQSNSNEKNALQNLQDEQVESGLIHEQNHENTLPSVKEELNKNEHNTNAFKQNPSLSILITNLGLNEQQMNIALSMPKEISIGLSAYSGSVKENIKEALIAREVYIELPLEPENYPIDEVGPLGILTSRDQSYNIGKVQEIFFGFPYAKGFYTLPNEKFSSQPSLFIPILDTLYDQGLLLIYGRGIESFNKIKNKAHDNQGLKGEKLNIKTKVKDSNINNKEKSAINSNAHIKPNKVIVCDVFIKLGENAEDIALKLSQVEEIAKKNGKAALCTFSYPLVLTKLKEWDLKSKDLNLVPLSNLIK